jgi:tripartite-type tricarboxylate transporter receptor subunit TctC
MKAPPDGYTLLTVDASAATSAPLYNNFNFIRDIAPVAGISREPQIMLVNPSVPARTVPEFVAYLKLNPGKISFGSGGVGGIVHLMAELFNMMAGINMVHVPYRGTAPALNDLLGGQVQVTFASVRSSLDFIRTGKLRGLAITSTTHSELLPEVPSMSDFLPGYEASNWVGIGAPRNTPAEIVNMLNKEINAALADPKTKARFADQGRIALPGSPAAFGKFIAEETEKWAKVIRAANIKARVTP